MIHTTAGRDVEAGPCGELLLNVAFARNLKHTRGLENLPVTWAALAAKFSETKYTDETEAQYRAMSKGDKTKAKDVGGIVAARLKDGRRSRESVEDVGLLMLDFDGGGSDALAGVWGAFCLWENAGFVHTTHSHTAEANRFRLAVPLSRPVTPSEYAPLGREVVRRLDAEGVADPSTYQPERLMFLPSTPKGGRYVFDYVGGAALDPDEFLSAHVVPSAPSSRPNGESKQKTGIIGAFCRVYSIDEAISEFLSEVYTPCDGRPGYYTYAGGSTAGGLAVLDGTSAFSHHGTDPANTGHAHNAFDLVRIHKFGALDKDAEQDTSPAKLPSFKAMADFARRLPPVAQEYGRELRERAASDYDGCSGSDALSSLLSSIDCVDFREAAGLDESDKVSRRVYVTVVVDKLLGAAKAQRWGLCTKNGYIYVYKGGYWQAIDEDDFRTFLGRAAGLMGVPPLDARYYQFKDDLFKQFMSEAHLPTPDAKACTLINLANGTLEVSKDGPQLRDQRPGDFLKYRLPFEYNEKARCPQFDAYLSRVLPDEACRAALAEYVGYVFTTELRLQKVAVLYGSGANGKSVFFDVVTALLGRENTSSFSLQNLTSPQGYQRAELSNKLLNYASEINGHLETDVFKQLASGEPVEARKIYGNPFTMYEYAKLMFNCNTLPTDVEHTHAFFRRFLIFPFTETIPEAEQDPNLSKKIIEGELSGVLNWALAGLERLLREKRFTESAAMREQAEAYRKNADSVALFIEEESYEKATDDHVSLKGMYFEYTLFCQDNGCRAVALRKMSERLRNLGFEVVKKNDGRVVYAKRA